MTRGLGRTITGLQAQNKGHQFHVGYVQSIQWTTSPASLTILFSANTNAVSGIHFLSSYSPQVGDYVMAIHTGSIRVQGGGDWLVLGAVAQLGGWQALSLVNSWASAGAPYAVPAASLGGATVSLRGVITLATAEGASAFTLPAGYWPSSQKFLPTVSMPSTTPEPASIVITTAGVATPYYQGATGEVALDGVSFPVD